MTQTQIAKLEKEIEKKVHVKAKPIRTTEKYRIDLEKVKKLAKKLRNYETQTNASTVSGYKSISSATLHPQGDSDDSIVTR